MSERENPCGCEYFEHTGDIGFRVSAGSPERLFEAAARAMMQVISDPGEVAGEEETEVRVDDAVDREDLLVRFLSELLFLHDARERMFSGVEVAELTEISVVAKARGERFDPARHRIERQVKAVTYHGLEVREEGRKWQASVVLDL